MNKKNLLCRYITIYFILWKKKQNMSTPAWGENSSFLICSFSLSSGFPSSPGFTTLVTCHIAGWNRVLDMSSVGDKGKEKRHVTPCTKVLWFWLYSKNSSWTETALHRKRWILQGYKHKISTSHIPQLTVRYPHAIMMLINFNIQ